MCMVCGQPAHFFSRDSEPLCLRAECKHVLGKKQHMGKKAYDLFFRLQAGQAKKTIEYVTVIRKKMEEKKAKETRENLACWTRSVKEELGLNPEEYPFSVIPTNAKKIEDLPAFRRQAFRTHVSELICEVVSDPLSVPPAEEPDHPGNPPSKLEQAFQIKACSICRGGCCKAGGDHAFLKPETISRVMEKHPDESPENVMDAYTGFLPEKNFKDSCVNHTASGCSLPKEMRSHICNRYLCDGLMAIQEMFAAKPYPKGVFFIRRAQDNWNKDDCSLDNPILAHELVLASRYIDE